VCSAFQPEILITLALADDEDDDDDDDDDDDMMTIM